MAQSIRVLEVVGAHAKPSEGGMWTFRVFVHLGRTSAVANCASAASPVTLFALPFLLELLLISFCYHTITWLITHIQAYLFLLDSSVLEPDLDLSVCQAEIA